MPIAIVFMTFSGLINVRVVLLLLPPVVLCAGGLQRTSLLILANEGLWLPIFTGDKYVIVVKLGFAPEILPVVRVLALRFVVFSVEWAPLCFEIEHVEVHVLCHIVNDTRLDVFHGVSKRTEFTVLAVVQVLWKLGAELCFIFFNMVESLNTIMGEFALILFFTSIGFCIIAHFRGVIEDLISPSSVLDGVVERAMLVVVLVVNSARFNFEFFQVKMSDVLRLHIWIQLNKYVIPIIFSSGARLSLAWVLPSGWTQAQSVV